MDGATPSAQEGADLLVEGYCVHCRVRQTMHGVIEVVNRRGGRALRGHCSVCGKSMYRMGGWNSITAKAQETTPKTS